MANENGIMKQDFFYRRPDALRDFIVTCKEKRKKFQILSIRGRAEPGRYKK